MPAPTVIGLERLRLSPTAHLFEGGDLIGVSIFVTGYARGQGVALHTHPYPEVFVIEAGTAQFTVGDAKLEVDAGNLVIVPGETPHGFEGAGDDTLRVLSVHPSGTVRQTDL